MATAAPAAPAAAPAPAPATGPGAASAYSDSPAVVGPADSSEVLTGPPEGLSRLPGVDSDFGEIVPRSLSSAGDPPTGSRSTPARGPDGRFLAAQPAPAQTDAEAGVHAGQPGDVAPGTDIPTEQSAPQKFRFADIDFDSQAHAEQSFKSLRGQFKPLTSLAREVGGLDKIHPTLKSAAESARGWHARAQELEAELAQYRNGRAPAATPQSNQSSQSTPTDNAAAKAEQPAVDWQLYAELKRLATESGEPWKAEQWLIEETQKAERARMEKLLEERLAPFTAAQQHAQTMAGTEQLFSNLATYTNADGSPAFPELHDETAAYEVGRLWANMGLPAEAAMTPAGAVAAIALYRQFVAGQATSSETAQPAATPQPPQNAPMPPAATMPTQTPHDAVAAASLADGRPSNASLAAPGQSSEAQRILAALRNVSATSSQRAALGFDA